jgi:hypothetical protein
MGEVLKKGVQYVTVSSSTGPEIRTPRQQRHIGDTGVSWYHPGRTQGSPRSPGAFPTVVSVAALRSPARTGRAISLRRALSSGPPGGWEGEFWSP